MDLRIIKTKRSIKEAFLFLRRNTELERIKVKDICDIALINKSTFYKYYQDVYELSETLETEIIQSITDALTTKDALLTRPELFIAELPIVLEEHKTTLAPLFHHRFSVLFNNLQQSLLDYYKRNKYTMEDEIQVTFIITGTFQTLQKMKMENKYSDKNLAEQLSSIIRKTNA